MGPAHGEENLGRNDDFVAARVVLERLADDLFGSAIRVGIRGVEEIDAHLDGFADQRTALLLGQSPGMIAALGHAERHAAEAERRNFEAGMTQVSIPHSGLSIQYVTKQTSCKFTRAG